MQLPASSSLVRGSSLVTPGAHGLPRSDHGPAEAGHYVRFLRRSISSSVFGQSSFNSFESARSASNRPSVWQSDSSSPHARRGRCAARVCRSADTGCPNRPCTAISSWKAVTFSGNLSPASDRSLSRPFRKDLERGCMEQSNLAGGELARELEGRQFRPMQDLVRVCIADAAEQMWIRQRALQCMAFLSEAPRQTNRRCSSLARARRDRTMPARSHPGRHGVMPAFS